MSNTRRAILLIAHGSRLDSANADLRCLTETVAAQRPDEIVEYAYLEIAEPSIPQGFEACVNRGASEVRLLPWFLSAGSHVTRDLEGFRSRFQQEHSKIKCLLCPPLGLHPLMIEALTDRLDEAE